jgi:hypothetical protein
MFRSPNRNKQCVAQAQDKLDDSSFRFVYGPQESRGHTARIAWAVRAVARGPGILAECRLLSRRANLSLSCECGDAHDFLWALCRRLLAMSFRPGSPLDRCYYLIPSSDLPP